MRNSETIKKDIKDANLANDEKATLLSYLESSKDIAYINSFDPSIYPEGLLSLIEQEFLDIDGEYPNQEKDYERIAGYFFQLYPNH